jgi:hypothetical protein
MVSSELKDPGLGTGWAYMVESAPYRRYLLGVTDQEVREATFCLSAEVTDGIFI